MWIPGSGPSGDVPAGAVVTVKSESAFTMSATDRKAIGFSLAKFLGLSLSSNSIYDVKLGDVSIYRVKDVTALPYRSGQQFILEGIKAASIEITLTRDSGQNLSAAASAKGLDASLTANGTSKSTLSIKGADLFLAFQVSEFGPAQLKETKVVHNGHQATVAGRFRFAFCNCIGPGKVRLTVVDNLSVSPTGDVPVITHEVPDGPNDWADLKLGTTFEQGTISRWSSETHYFRNRRCFGKTTDPQGQERDLCMVDFPKQGNYVILRQSSFAVRPVRKPEGLF